MSAEKLDFADELFDVVTAIEVIEHVLDLGRALFEINRVLKVGGAFLVTCPNEVFPIELHNLRIGRRRVAGRYVPFVPWVRPLHRRIGIARNLSAGGLRSLLERNGFRTHAIDYVMPPFDHWQAGRRRVKPLLDRIEGTPLRVLGVSLAGVFVKEAPAQEATGAHRRETRLG